MADSDAAAPGTRTLVPRAFTAVEDGVYVGLGGLLAVGAVLLLGSAAVSFVAPSAAMIEMGLLM